MQIMSHGNSKIIIKLLSHNGVVNEVITTQKKARRAPKRFAYYNSRTKLTEHYELIDNWPPRYKCIKMIET